MTFQCIMRFMHCEHVFWLAEGDLVRPAAHAVRDFLAGYALWAYALWASLLYYQSANPPTIRPHGSEGHSRWPSQFQFSWMTLSIFRARNCNVWDFAVRLWFGIKALQELESRTITEGHVTRDMFSTWPQRPRVNISTFLWSHWAHLLLSQPPLGVLGA